MADFSDPFKTNPVADPFAKGYEPPPSIASDFVSGVKQGIHSAKGAAYGLVGLAGDALGAEGVKNYGLTGYMREDAAANAAAPSVSRIEDVNGIGDFAHYAAGGVGSLVPFAATSALGGGIGGVAARVAARKGAEKFAEQAIAKGVDRTLVDKAVQERTAKAIEQGAITGAGASSVGTEQGIIEGQTYTQTGKTDPGAAAGYGLAAGLVDVIPEAQLIHGLVGSGAKKAAAKGLARTVGEQGALGAGTEAAQTYLENKGTEAADPTQPALSEQGTSDMVNSAIIGGLGQALTGGAGHLLARAGAKPKPAAAPGQPAAEAPAATPADVPAVPPGATPPGDAHAEDAPTIEALQAARVAAPISAPEAPPAEGAAAPIPPAVTPSAPQAAEPPAPGDWRAQRMAKAAGTVDALQSPPGAATAAAEAAPPAPPAPPAGPDVPPITEDAMARMHDAAAGATRDALRPWHQANAGPLTKVAGAAVESGMTPDPYAGQPLLDHPERVATTNPPDLQMQNRDRTRPASIAQMNAIANNPDYDRLGVGKSPNEAAPMVSVAANQAVIPPAQFGKSSTVVLGDGSKVGVRYAVVEAPDVLASNNADGSVNGDYFGEIPPGTIRALNNGRVAGLQEAYSRGTAEQYRAALIAHTDEHGVPAEAIAALKNPMLVRVYDDGENARKNIGALSNPQSNLTMSAPEQAQNDAEKLDAGALEPDDHGDVMGPANEKALRAFLGSIPQAEHGGLVTKTGYTKQFGDRVKAALFAKAYGNPDLVAAATEEADPDVKNLLHALTAAAPDFARVDHGGPLDVRPNLIEAFNVIREAKRKGLKPAEIAAQSELGGREPMTQMLLDFMVANTRSPRRMAAAFAEAARFLENERQASTSGDMFGRPAATPTDLAARINAHLERTDGQESTAKLAAERQTEIGATAQRAPASAGGEHAASAGDGGESGQHEGAAAGAAGPVSEAVAKFESSEDIKALSSAAHDALIKLVALADAKKPAFDAKVAAIAAKLDGEAMLAPIKGPKRAIEKIQSDYRGDATKIKDLLRATIIVHSSDDARAAVKALHAAFTITGERDLFSPEADPADGYRDAKLNVKIGELTAEVQVNLPQMIAAKKVAHVHYERRARLERKLMTEGRDPTPPERRALDALNAIQKRIYDKAYAAALATSARKSDSDSGEPLRRADAGLKARGGDASQAAPYKPGTPAPSDTGIPSTSKNSAPLGKESGREGERAIDSTVGPNPRKGNEKPTESAAPVARPPLALEGQTEGQAQADRAQRAKAEADARARALAPAPEDFRLTGSNRPADENVAQRDLFATMNEAIEKVPLRPDATEKVLSARDKALRELTQAGRLSVLAARINLDLVQDGSASLIGRPVTSMHDLAAVAQVYRDPRYETLRYVFTKGGKVVHETAFSSRLPATSASFRANASDAEWYRWIAETKQRAGADAWYMLHNHPTGDPKPSEQDLKLTDHVTPVKGFAGHVIIDTNAYSVIDRNGRWRTIAKDFGAAPARTEGDGILGETLQGFAMAAELAKRVQNPGMVSIIGLDGDTSINALAEMPHAHVSFTPRAIGRLARFARASGSGGGLVLMNVPMAQKEAVQRLLHHGSIRAAVMADNDVLLALGGRPFTSLGHEKVPVVEHSVNEEQFDLFGGEKRVETVRADQRSAVQKAMPQLDLFGQPVSTPVDKAGQPSDNGGKGATNEGPRQVRNDRPQQPPRGGSGALFGPGSERPVGAPSDQAGAGSDGRNPETQGRPGAPGERPGERPAPSGTQPGAGPTPDQGPRDQNGGRAGRIPRPRPYQVPDRPGVNFTITRPEVIGTGGAKEKYRANIDAIKLLKQIEADNRLATPAEQETLARYVGWGGLKNAFFLGDSSMLTRMHADGELARANLHMEIGQAAEWAKERRELVGLLTAEEYDLARGSTPNAHYTAPQVISAMWNAVSRLGFNAGRVLEPAMGVGHFFGLMPDAMRAGSALAGVELDSISGRISKQLYQKADVRVSGFENAVFPDGFFDLAISNVPFGDYKVNDKAYNKYGLLIHDYFFAKALDRVRVGGVVAFITSDGTMDKGVHYARALIGKKAELLGAIRLPNNAFKANAATEVTTDIIFLRKRDPAAVADATKEEAWTQTQEVATPDGSVRVNEYYARHPEMMLGTLGKQGSMYGANDTALVSDGRDLAVALREAIARLPKDAMTTAAQSKAFTQPFAAPDELKPGALFVKDGRVFQKNTGMATPMPHLPADKVAGLVTVRDAARAHLAGQVETDDPARFEATAKTLNSAYDAYVRKHGYLNLKANAAVILEDADGPLLLALEKWNPDTGKATKADTFAQRTVARQVPVEGVESAGEALVVSLNERGRVDLAHMAQISGLSEAELIGGLEGRIYHDPVAREWAVAEDYLSGNVREKLRDAESAAASDPRYEPNVNALRAVIPNDIPAEQIRVRLGQSWVPVDLVKRFAQEIFAVSNDRHINIAYAPTTTDWRVTNKGVNASKPEVRSVWGVSGADGFTILESALNQQKPTIYRTVDGDRVKDPVATAAAAEKVDLMRAEWEAWWQRNEDVKTGLHRLYNDSFNNLRQRQFDGAHLTLPGTNPLISLRDNVKNGAWRIISGGNTLLAHAVGAGKTFTAIAGSMELKRLGLRRKPMHVVPNHMLEQYSREWLQLYPNSNLLLARKEELRTADGRKTLTAKIATGNWDGVVITHSSFGKIGMSDEYVGDYMRERIRAVEEAMLEARADKADPRLLKRLEKRKKDLQAKLSKQINQESKDDVIRFEELGVDQLFVDEAHYFKNLGFDTKMDRIAGISDADSQRSMDMFLKTQYLDGVNNGKGGLVFMTGTPISNSVTEMYTMQRYLGMRALRANHLDHFDSWAAQFGEAVTQYEMRADGGGYAPKTRFAKFVNMGELAQQFGSFADVKTAEMLKLPVPAMKTGKPIPVLSPMTQQMEDFVADLVDRAELVRAGAVLPTQDNMLKITSDGRKAALDMRLVLPGSPDLPDSKVNKAVASIYDVWKESSPTKAAQLVFLDQSTPKPGGGFSVYTDIRNKLIERGVPASEVAFIQSANTDAKKDQLFQAVREGRVRVLIGSTDKMGAGTNVQRNLIALHHLDVPWRPSDIEQRNGRIIRQGNQNKEVGVYHYIAEGSFDTFMWQTVERKASFIAQAMNADPSMREIEEVGNHVLTYAELKAFATGNPLVLEKANVDGELARLTAAQSRHAQEQSDLRRQAAQFDSQVAALTRYAAAADQDQARLQDTRGDKFSAIFGDKPYTDRVEAANALAGAMSRVHEAGVPTPIGELGGFPVSVLLNGYTTTLQVRGVNSYSVQAGTSADGNLQRLENLVASIAGEGDRARAEAAERTRNAATAREAATRPFAKADQVTKLLQRQREIDQALGIGQDDQQAAGDDDGAGPPAAGQTIAPLTPAFKQWFGNSKVVDEQGRPVVVYRGEHGASDAQFHTRSGSLTFGTLDAANQYATSPNDRMDGPPQAARVLPMYLRIEKPLVNDASDPFIGLDTLKAALGEKEALRIASRYAYAIEATDNWNEISQEGNGYASVADFLKAHPERVGDLYFDFYNLLDDHAEVAKLRAAGFDGAIYGGSGDNAGEPEYRIFDERQAKSAVGNRGTFDVNDPRVVAQSIMPLDMSRGVRQGIQNAVADVFTTQRTLSPWMKSVGTQFHTAQTVPEFRPAYEAAQRFINDTARLANEAADLAPDILPKLSGVREIFKLGPSTKDLKAVAGPLFQGTLTDLKEYSADELRGQFKLNDKQVALYQQARATINRSLELLSQTEMARLVRDHVPADVLAAALKDTHHGGMIRLREALVARSKQALTEDERAFYSGLGGDLWNKYGKIRELIREGYAPLMRFGQYTVDLVDADGKRQYFGMFESQAEANAMARRLREEFPTSTLNQGVLSKDSYKLFKGLTPDTMELFAEALGLDKHEAFQEFARMAVNNRSTLKRLIQRQGIAGFDQDAQRVLAAFVTSNSRAASSNLHAKAMLDGVAQIPKQMGDVKDQAMRLVDYLQNPQDEAPNLRGFLFVNFLGGSMASALVNMTQPFMMTLPYLTQFGVGRGAAALMRGMREAVTGVNGDAMKAALARAEKEGTVAPHEIHQLYAESIRGLGQNIYLRKGLKVWGSMFSLAEQFNRRSTFIAAHAVAEQMTPEELAKAGFATPYDFAVHAIAETQGVYNRGNRPNWGRGAIGATLMTFKQFSIAYLEFLKRLPPRERTLALSLLVLASGVQGLPFADDLDDLIDTIAQSLGYNWNTKAAKRAFLANTLGKEWGTFMLHGASTLPGIPLDIQGRLSLGNLIPGTGLLKRSEQDKTRDTAELLGPVGGLLTNAGRAFTDVQGGNLAKAGREFAPKALRDAAQAVEMMQTGYAIDSKGRRVLATDAGDAAVKAIGFNPAKVADESRRMGEQQQNIDLAKAVQTNVADHWAQGLFENDPKKVQSAQAELRDWNEKNPTAKLSITPLMIRERVQAMQQTRADRFVKAAPKGLREEVRQAVR